MEKRMASEYLIYIRVAGEPFLSRANAYAAACQACHLAWETFRLEKRADGIPGSYAGGLLFNRNAPEGWTKPKGKYGFSRPKTGHCDLATISALPSRPRSHEVFGDAVLYSISYEWDEGNGSGSIGYQWEPYVFWVGDDCYAHIPDAKRAADNHFYRDRSGFRITNGADKWELPEGLERISDAQMDLIIAQHNLAVEQANAA
jgi:hypothetical protein